MENRVGLLQRLADNETDLAIMGRPPHSEEIIAENFAPHPHVIIAAASHPLAGQRDIPLQKLQNDEWIVVHLRKKWLPPVAVAFRKFLQTEGENAVAGILPVAGARMHKKPSRGTMKPSRTKREINFKIK